MGLFTEKHTIKLTEEIIQKAKEFAKEVVETTNYEDSNQNRKKKIIKDHFVSKLGEEAVRIILENHGRDVIGPDYEIYKAKEKSWDSDLYVNELGLAVKTQTRSAALRYGLSWTFQYIPNGRSDPILSQSEAWVFFVEYIDNEEPANKLIVFPPKQKKDYKFEEPIMNYLKGKKKVVYAKNLYK